MMRRRWWIVSILLVLTLVLGCGLPRTSKTKEEIMAEVEDRAATVDSYRADLTMTMEMMGEEMITQGKMVFKKPNRSRMEMVMDMGTMKMKQVVVSNGQTAWTYQPEMKMVTKINLEKIAAETKQGVGKQMAGDISKPFQVFQRESISYIRTGKMDGGKVYVFQGVPKTAEMQQTPFAPAKMEMWIGVDDGLLRKMIMFNEKGKETMSQSYTNIELNMEVADSQFEFTPPEGVQVTDMTEGTLNMIKQMKGAGK